RQRPLEPGKVEYGLGAAAGDHYLRLLQLAKVVLRRAHDLAPGVWQARREDVPEAVTIRCHCPSSAHHEQHVARVDGPAGVHGNAGDLTRKWRRQRAASRACPGAAAGPDDVPGLLLD